ncbi:hypothetical protein ACFL0Y_00515 [Patescibacteria group bacterium]
MTLEKYTLFNVLIIEAVFFIAKSILKRKKLVGGFLTSFILGVIVLYFSFGGAVASFLKKVILSGGTPKLIDILLLFFNMFYGYLRGLSRIASLNKKYGNL